MRFRFVAFGGRRERPMIDRAFFRERMRRNFRHDFAVILHAHQAAVFHFTDDDGVESPLFENV